VKCAFRISNRALVPRFLAAQIICGKALQRDFSKG
jgi:hypothetical protein